MKTVSTNMGKIAAVTATLVGILLASACGGGASQPTAVPQANSGPTPAPAALVARGKQLFSEKICISCHTIKGNDQAIGQVGPNLSTIYSDAKQIIQTPEYKAVGKATTAEGYILESIDNPNLYIYPKCPTGPCVANVMVQNFKDTTSPEDIDAIVAYLVTLR